MCVRECEERDAGAPWADITQDARGGGRRGYRRKEALCGARNHTCDPLLTRLLSQTHTHTLHLLSPSAEAR